MAPSGLLQQRLHELHRHGCCSSSITLDPLKTNTFSITSLLTQGDGLFCFPDLILSAPIQTCAPAWTKQQNMQFHASLGLVHAGNVQALALAHNEDYLGQRHGTRMGFAHVACYTLYDASYLRDITCPRVSDTEHASFDPDVCTPSGSTIRRVPSSG